ncbi:hypothetical protein C8R41DRAFT_870194 [Lentinula lateritia]|uniref:Uncharacterized protein n=1 Tax=Lentinula lateritia TaxID=40482 RepID=A0ABQ8V4J9_9AGAR|nr:hypothetical protein C8R41DRAFT_870194 [Lentinula lateritia]
MYFNPVYLVLGLASAAYAMPFVATTPATTPQNSQPQLITRANSRSSLIAKIAFTGPHEGQGISEATPIHGFAISSSKEAEDYGIMPSKIYKRVKKAVKSLVPQEHKDRDLILTFEAHFAGSTNDVFEICLTWNGQGTDAYYLKIDKKGNVVPGSLSQFEQGSGSE